MTVSADFLASLVRSGSFSTAIAVQEAAAEQVNNATTGSTGSDTQTTNQAWGKAIPELIGQTRTVGLPLWTGNPIATLNSNNDEHDTIDFAVMIGRIGPRATDATLLRVWFDNVLVYDAGDQTVTTLTGEPLKFTFYNGQQKVSDPLIEQSAPGAAPAYTGCMYIVFESLTTRIIDATTTTTQFNKLPEVQCEVAQKALHIAAGQIVYPLDGAPLPRPAYFATLTFNSDTNVMRVIGSTIETYDLTARDYIGTTSLDFSGTGFTSDIWRNEDPCVMGSLIAVYSSPIMVWDMVTGAQVASMPTGYGTGGGYGTLSIGGGLFMVTHLTPEVFRIDGSDVKRVLTKYGPYSLGSAALCDYPRNLGAITNFKGSVIAYIASNAGAVVRAIFGAVGLKPFDGVSDGCDKVSFEVGRITHDGSNAPVHGTGGFSNVVAFGDGHRAIGVIVDDNDPRFIWAFVVAPDQTFTLRKFATFYYFNPQDGSAPPAGSQSIFSDFNYTQELDSVALPGNRVPFLRTSIENRDRRSGLFCYQSGIATQVVVDYTRMQSIAYDVRAAYDPSGNYIGDYEADDTAFYAQRLKGWIVRGNSTRSAGPALIRPKANQAKHYTYSLHDLYTDLCLLAGYTLDQILCDGMDDTILGCQLNQTVAFADLMAQLNVTFRVDLIEMPDGTLHFSRRLDVTQPDYVIPASQLLPSGSSSNPGNSVAIDRVATNELPTVLQLSFINVDFGYVVGAATVRRVSYPQPTVFGKSFLALSIPVVMGGEDAQYYAGVALFDMWAGKSNFSINLPPYFIFVMPGDFIELIRPSGQTNLCKITEVTIGADKTIAVTLSSVNSLKPLPYYNGQNKPTQAAPLDVGSSVAGFGQVSPNGVLASIIDNVPFGVADYAQGEIGIYPVTNIAADIYTQDGSNLSVKLCTTVPCVIGVLSSTLYDTAYAHQVDTTDVIAVTIPGDAAAPVSVTEAAFRSGSSAVAIGGPGRWEVVWFRDVAVAGSVVTLSRLLRGRLGTDSATGRHTPSDIAVFLSAGFPRGSVPIGALGKTLKVYAVLPGARPTAQGNVYDVITLGGFNFVPRAPSDVRAKRQQNGDVVFTWHRVDRMPSASFWDDPPMSEAVEQYALTLPTLTGGRASSKVVYTNTTTYTYTASDQQSDGNDTAIKFAVTVGQISSSVGVGYLWKGVVDV